MLLCQQGLDKVLPIARAKTFFCEKLQSEPISAVEVLALLSYKVNLYTSIPVLVETLTAAISDLSSK